LTSLLAAYSLRKHSEVEYDDRRGADERSRLGLGCAAAGSNAAAHAEIHMIRHLDQVPDVNVLPRHVI
jgi:hypothetical protein